MRNKGVSFLADVLLIGLIPLVVSAVILLGLVGVDLKDLLLSTGKEGACETSIFKLSLKEKIFSGTINELRCPTDKIEVHEKAIETIAESMVDCWNRYGKGKRDFLSNAFGIDSYCFVCSEVNVDGTLNVNELIGYLNERKIAGVSYWDYLDTPSFVGELKDEIYVVYVYSFRSFPYEKPFMGKNTKRVMVFSPEKLTNMCRTEVYIGREF